MGQKPAYFDQAADTLTAAFAATNPGEQAALLDKALGLHRRAVAQENAKLAEPAATPEAED